MFDQNMFGALVQIRIGNNKDGEPIFDENNSGQICGAFSVDNKIVYVILDHNTGMFREHGAGDFRTVDVKGVLQFVQWRRQ